MTQVGRALKQFVKDSLRWPVITGTVRAVNGDMCDVDPADGGPTLYDVRLKPAATDGQMGMIAYPMKGSNVVLLRLNGDDNAYAVAQVERIERMHVELAGGATLDLLPNGMLHINGDAHKGLVKVQELRQDLAKVNTFLETLRNALNTAPGGGDVVPFKIALNAALAPLQLPTYATIESQTTKHGGA